MAYVLRVSDVVPGPLGKTYYEFQKMTKNNKATFSFVSHFLEVYSQRTREKLFPSKLKLISSTPTALSARKSVNIDCYFKYVSALKEREATHI